MTGELTAEAVEAFIDSYRLAFERRDADAVADHFAYPSQVLSQADEHPVLVTIARKSQWLPKVKALLQQYQAAGVYRVRVASQRVQVLSKSIALAFVEWSLVDLAGDELYRFDNVYTVTPAQGSLRVVAAISPNELQRARRRR